MKNIKYLILLILISFQQNTGWSQLKQPDKVIIKGTFINHREDTLTLSVTEEVFGPYNGVEKLYRTNTIDGSFRFELPNINKLTYINLHSKKWPRLYLSDYTIEPGDSIEMTIDPAGIRDGENIMHKGLSFKGKNVEKFNARKMMDSIDYDYQRHGKIPTIKADKELEDLNLILNNMKLTDSEKLKTKMAVLETQKNSMSAFAYEVLKADTYYNSIWRGLSFFGFIWDKSFVFKDSLDRKNKIRYFFKTKLEPEIIKEGFSKKSLLFSKDYSKFIRYYSVYKCKQIIDKRNATDATQYKQMYPYVPDWYKEKWLTLITTTIYIDLNVLNKKEDFLKFAYSKITNKKYKKIISSVANTLTVGNPSFPFSLPDMNDKTRTLSEFKGKTIVMDFWFTGCKACVILNSHLKEVKATLKPQKDIVFMSVSTDIQKQEWIESIHKEIYTEVDNINLYTEGLGFDHPMIKHYNFNGFPQLLIINPAGKIHSTGFPSLDDSTGKNKLTNTILSARSN